jgi:hypothetical protein
VLKKIENFKYHGYVRTLGKTSMGNMLEHIWKTLETKWKRCAKELDLKTWEKMRNIWDIFGKPMGNTW